MIRAKLTDLLGIFQDTFIEDLPSIPTIKSRINEDFVSMQKSLNDNEKELFLQAYRHYNETIITGIQWDKDENGYFIWISIGFFYFDL